MMRSLKKKIVSLVSNGLEPLEEGINNFKHPNVDVELLAKERKETCVGCPMYKKEPIPMFRVIDKNIPELSNIFCDLCGCTLSYKLRQSLDKCNKWQK